MWEDHAKQAPPSDKLDDFSGCRKPSPLELIFTLPRGQPFPQGDREHVAKLGMEVEHRLRAQPSVLFVPKKMKVKKGARANVVPSRKFVPHSDLTSDELGKAGTDNDLLVFGCNWKSYKKAQLKALCTQFGIRAPANAVNAVYHDLLTKFKAQQVTLEMEQEAEFEGAGAEEDPDEAIARYAESSDDEDDSEDEGEGEGEGNAGIHRGQKRRASATGGKGRKKKPRIDKPAESAGAPAVAAAAAAAAAAPVA